MKIKRFNESIQRMDITLDPEEYWVVVEYSDYTPGTVTIFPDKQNAEDYIVQIVNEMREDHPDELILHAEDALNIWNKHNDESKIDFYDARMKTQKVHLSQLIIDGRIKEKREKQFDL